MRVAILFLLSVLHSFAYDLATESSTRGTIFETSNVDFSKAYSLAPTNNTTALSTFDGTTYFVWVDADNYPQITKIPPSGIPVTTRLDNDDDYTVYPDAHHTFSLGVDKNGYVHVVGDMHNFDPSLSGANVPDYLSRFDGANIMYWVSDTNDPEADLTFSFIGDNPSRSVPGGRFSYCKFYNDQNMNLFMIARIQVYNSFTPGSRAVGLYRYNVETQSWVARGALPPASNFTPLYPCILWEDNGHSGGGYQGFMATLVFDMRNRMHFAATINDNDDSPDATHVVYAYSDDGGLSFHKATHDSSIPSLPMRASGANAADIVTQVSNVNEFYWIYAGVFVDGQGTPAVSYWKKSDGAFVPAKIQHFDHSTQSWSEPYNNPVNGTSMVQPVCDANGVISYVEQGNFGQIKRSLTHNSTNSGQWNFASFVSLDRLALRQNGVHLFVASTGDNHLSVEKIEYHNRGSFTRELWTGVNGDNLSALKNHPQFPLTPDLSEEVQGDLVSLTNWGDNYGTRLRGMIHPDESGFYTFYLSGDDHCEFWLSSNATFAQAAKIAEVKTPTPPLTYTSAEQTSPSIFLKAGHRYYFEALHKEGSADDHMAISWTTPSNSTSSIIPASHLSSWAGIPESSILDTIQQEEVGFIITNVTPDGSITHTTEAGYTYQLQYTDNLTKPTNWQNIGAPYSAVDGSKTNTFQDSSTPLPSQRFYRIQRTP